MIRKEQLYEQILEQIDLTKETDDEELQELIRTVLDEAADEEYISLSDKIRIGRELFNSFRKLDVLQELLEDDSITEIMVNGIDHIFYEKEGRIFRSKKCFLSQERLLDVIQQIVGESNRYVNDGLSDCGCKAEGWISSKCCIESGCCEWTNPYNPKVSIGSNYDGTADPYRQRN